VERVATGVVAGSAAPDREAGRTALSGAAGRAALSGAARAAAVDRSVRAAALARDAAKAAAGADVRAAAPSDVPARGRPTGMVPLAMVGSGVESGPAGGNQLSEAGGLRWLMQLRRRDGHDLPNDSAGPVGWLRPGLRRTRTRLSDLAGPIVSAGRSGLGRAGSGRLAPLGALVAVAAGVLVVALFGAAMLDSRSVGDGGQAVVARPLAAAPATAGPTATPTTPPTAPPTASTATGIPQAAASPAAEAPAVRTRAAEPPTIGSRPDRPRTPRTEPRAIFNEFDRRLSAAASAGRVRTDVAVDLRNWLNDVRSRAQQGNGVQLRQSVINLRQKLDNRVKERSIDARTANQLSSVLTPLLG
jgi:hypothetical protein